MARLAAPFALVALSVLFRLPALVHAAGTNSDAAVVGLQAMHILEGEHGAWLWGSRYQTSADAYVAAAFFALLGAGPRALMLSTLAGHTAATVVTFAVLRRHVATAWAFALSLLLVFTTSPVHTYVLYPPRQLALTLAVAAIGAALLAMRSAALAFAAGLLQGLAVAADPYAVVMLPGWLAAMAPARGEGAARPLVPGLGGLAVGLVPFALLATHPASAHGVFGAAFDPQRLLAHGRLLLDEALPWLVGLEVYVPRHAVDWVPLARGPAWRGLAVLGVGVLGALLAGAAVRIARGGVDPALRRVGLVGFALIVAPLVAFVPSTMVHDRFAARYLVAAVYGLPLALAPVAAGLSAPAFAPARRWAPLALAPVLAAQGLAGWAGFAPAVERLALAWPPAGRSEQDLLRALGAAGIRYAVADYWVAYRITFLAAEQVVVVPVHPEEDRHEPYRRAALGAPRIAYIFDPWRSRETPAEALAFARRLGHLSEVVRIDGVTAYLLTRDPLPRDVPPRDPLPRDPLAPAEEAR